MSGLLSPSSTAYVLLLLTSLFWGGNAVAGKLAIGHVSPMVLTSARWGFACLVLLVIGWPKLRRDWRELRRHWVLLAALGAAGFTMFNVALYTALLSRRRSTRASSRPACRW